MSGVVSNATWSRASSPFLLAGNVSVASLTIEPGVTVLATGDYLFEVVGVLTAAGTAQAPIAFGVSPCHTGGWQGIRFNAAQPGTFRHVSVSGARASGVRVVDSSPTLANCRVHDNVGLQGGGIFVQGAMARVTVRNCVVANNVADDFFEAGGGLFVRDGASVTVENSILSHNSTVYANARGGGVFVCGGQVNVVNSVVFENGQSVYGNGSGGIAVNTGGLSDCGGAAALDLQSSVVFGNVPFQLSGSGIVATYSAVQGGFAGTGNISANPVFADGAFHLLGGSSPAIDAGNPAMSANDTCFPPSLGTGRNDIGAYGGPGACSW